MKKEISAPVLLGIIALVVIGLGTVIYLMFFRAKPDAFPKAPAAPATIAAPEPNRPPGYAPAGPRRPANP